MLTLWNGVAAASPNLASLLVFRFLAGAFGSSPLTNAGGTIADVFKAKERGLAMAVFAAGSYGKFPRSLTHNRLTLFFFHGNCFYYSSFHGTRSGSNYRRIFGLRGRL